MKRGLLMAAALLLPAVPALAEGLPLFTSAPAAGGGQAYTLNIQAMLLLTAITFLPAILLMTTAFTRIVIVLSLLRQAIGTAQTPPNQIIIGMSLFLTLFVMGPTLALALVARHPELGVLLVGADGRVARGGGWDSGAPHGRSEWNRR